MGGVSRKDDVAMGDSKECDPEAEFDEALDSESDDAAAKPGKKRKAGTTAAAAAKSTVPSTKKGKAVVPAVDKSSAAASAAERACATPKKSGKALVDLTINAMVDAVHKSVMTQSPMASGAPRRQELKRKRDEDRLLNGPPKKKCKVGSVVESIEKEYDAMLKTLQEDKDDGLKSHSANAIIGTWGRKKGCLVAAKRHEDIEYVDDIIGEAKIICRALYLGENLECSKNGLSNAAQLGEILHRLNEIGGQELLQRFPRSFQLRHRKVLKLHISD